MAGSRPIDLDGIEWDAIRDHPIPGDVLRVVAYMQDVESHTVVFPRTFFSPRALWRAGHSEGEFFGLVGTLLAISANPPHWGAPPTQFARAENRRRLKGVAPLSS